MPTVDESVSQAIDVFHLPSGVDVSDYEIYEVATSDGVKRLRYPRLDGPKVTSLAKQLADVRNRTLAAMSVNDILDIVECQRYSRHRGRRGPTMGRSGF